MLSRIGLNGDGAVYLNFMLLRSSACREVEKEESFAAKVADGRGCIFYAFPLVVCGFRVGFSFQFCLVRVAGIDLRQPIGKNGWACDYRSRCRDSGRSCAIKLAGNIAGYMTHHFNSKSNRLFLSSVRKKLQYSSATVTKQFTTI